MTTQAVCKVCWRPLPESSDINSCCSKACASAPRTDWDALRGKYHAEEMERRYPTEVARAPYINSCPMHCTDPAHDHPRAKPYREGPATTQEVVEHLRATNLKEPPGYTQTPTPRESNQHNAWYMTRFNLIVYLKDKVDAEDWHAVSDAANDLRVLEAQEPK